MQFHYISSVMQSDDFSELFAGRPNIPGQQVQKYHRLLIEGLAENGRKVHVISSAPISSENYPPKLYPGKKHPVGNITYRYLPVINLPGLKTLMQMLGSFFSVLTCRNKKEQVVICDVLNASVSFGAVTAAKLRGIPCVGVVTDLPDMMVTCGNQKYVKLVNKNIWGCTHYVLLTEQMNEVVNPAHKPYTIIEGLCDIRMQKMPVPTKKDEKACLYAGLLDERYGVKTMVDAFLMADIPGAVFHIYGGGPYAEELSQVAETHPNIRFHGSVLNEAVVTAELRASLLVNPRPTTEEFTKYSFPSKNMEYMVSGTPVLTTNLPGMPREYCDFVYLFEDESAEGMANTFRTLLSRSEDERRQTGAAAREFVLSQKNNVSSAFKLIELLEK